MPTYFDDLDKYSDYIVVIRNTATGGVIKGLLDDEMFGMNSNADIGESSIASGALDLAKGAGDYALKKYLPKGADLISKTLKDNVKTVMSTFKGYEDSKHTEFSLNIKVFPGKFGISSYTDLVYKLGTLTLPNTEDDMFIKSYLYTPELILGLTSSDPFENKLIHVSIGSWFHATGLFAEASDPSFSKFVDTNQRPVYADVQFNFTSHKVLNAQQWSSWFLK